MTEDLYIIEISHSGHVNDWTLQFDLIYAIPNSDILNQVAESNPGLKVRWRRFKSYSTGMIVQHPEKKDVLSNS
jgi:hypothetical protein